jgi:radical SAM family uncharacterized protein
LTFKHEELLASVRKPGRYIGREWNAHNKDFRAADVSVCLAYPDAYEVGMSNLGLSILYEIINADEQAVCERAYAPWPDMEEAMRGAGAELWSLESKIPLREFDVLGFTLQHELNYSNVLNMIDMGGIPLRAADRGEGDPIVLGGGPCAFNPEPVAPFFDAFLIGDGEEAITEIVNIVKSTRSTESTKSKRKDLLEALAGIEGVYVPSLYDPKQGPVKKRILDDLERFFPPCSPPVPYTEVVHDRLQVEVMRGCGRSCRFCQAGIIYRPVRQRSAETVIKAARQGLANTGYNEVSLVSLSTSDYEPILEVAKTLVPELKEEAATVSLPSQRVDAFSVELAETFAAGKQTSLTFAPEAGTQRLRDAINKGVTEEDMLKTAELAFSNGWRKLKLYFMIGLPTETGDDLDGIVDLAYTLRELALRVIPKQEHGRINITVNVSSFVPKPHTPYQWAAQDSLEVLTEKSFYLKDRLKKSFLKFRWSEPATAKLEAVLAKGDARIADAIEIAFRSGVRFDSWREHFDFSAWQNAFKEAGLAMEEFSDRTLGLDEPLPWDKIGTGVSKEFMRKEYAKTTDGRATEPCLTGCAGCGLECTG